MENKILNKIFELGNDVFLNEPMKCHVSFKIGGKVPIFVVPLSIEMFINTYKILEKIRHVRILGNGTNILPRDGNHDLVILATSKLNEINIHDNEIICESGVDLKKICFVAAKSGFSGFEKLYGIPGTIGGAIYMNAGAFGVEISELLSFVEVFDGNKVFRLKPSELEFGYRDSIFRKNRDLIILKAGFRVYKDEKEKIYKEMNEILKKRIEKQPLEYPSAGSVFKRPKRDFYVGSAIEKLGLKGFSVGGAKISEKHAGFIVNYNNATAEDVLSIINYVKNKIFEKYGVNLETEIEIW